MNTPMTDRTGSSFGFRDPIGSRWSVRDFGAAESAILALERRMLS
jgi:hypothetical protein